MKQEPFFELKDQDPLIGQVLDGRYRILEKIGIGGLGVVYRAEHTRLRRPAAIKVMHKNLSDIEELRRRFEREARALSALSHPHIVSVMDFGFAQGILYLAMELLEGRPLDVVLREAIPEPERALGIAAQILRGMAFAHERGIIHRDLTPANVFLQSSKDGLDHVKLLDFGLAKFIEQGDQANEPTLTRQGTIFGTPAYMAPEQAAGAVSDVRSDVYSAGIVLFELLAGRRPFLGSSPQELIREHLLTPVPALSSARPGLEVSPELEAIVRKALAKEKDQRFADAGEMLRALESLPRPAAIYRPAQRRNGGLRISGVAQRPEEAHLPTVRVTPVSNVKLRGARPKWVLTLIGLMGVAGLAAGIVLGLQGKKPTPKATKERPLIPNKEWSKAVAKPSQVTAQSQPASVVVPPTVRVEPRNPWKESVPRVLARLRKRSRLDGGDQRTLHQFAIEHPDDGRPFLVSAYHAMNREWYRDAVDYYRRAYAADPGCRGDPRMLKDLVALVQVSRVESRAASAVRFIYGLEALPTLEVAIERADDSDKANRLRALRESLLKTQN